MPVLMKNVEKSPKNGHLEMKMDNFELEMVNF